ncbi:MFS transporter [Parachlamydia sp.]|uniref:MFS transporter n=1 Tax=Parachlamydia sp. TaxID=2052048 RepID=UPI003D0FEB5F
MAKAKNRMVKALKRVNKKSLNQPMIRRVSSFTYLNVTQFLGALNDNIYKLLIVYFFIQLEGIENSHKILAMSGAIFVLPFLLFSASSGTLADRFSKRNIIVLTKVFELVIMGLGILAFLYESKLGSCCILFLLATQSAIFGPSKYGILPELVETDKISKANGLMTSFTFLAIILGTFSASFLLDITGRDFIAASIFCTLIAFAGMLTSFCIEYTPPAGSSKRFNIRFLHEIYETLKFARNEPSLLAAILGSAFFLFLGAFVQLNMIPFAVQSLHLTDIQGGYLFLLTAMGIGTGSLLAGKISGKIVELGLVPLAGIGIVFSCYLMDLFSDRLAAIIPLVMILGMFGGMYQIPLDSYIQVASPNKYRGQIIAATNFLSFFGVLCASCLLYILAEVFGLGADKGFTIIGNISLIVTIAVTFQFFDYLSRFVAMILSRLHFKIRFNGVENIPKTPAIYVCTHTAWNDTLILLGAQRRRIRFFIEQEQDHTKWFKRFYHLLRVVQIPSIQPLENNADCLTDIKKSLDRGSSVCIFVENENVCEELYKLEQAYSIQKILKDTPYQIIPVAIEKGEKETASPFFTRLLEKFRVPASISFGALVCKKFHENEMCSLNH